MGAAGAVAVMRMKERHIVYAFRDAAATSPETAVVPEEIGVDRWLAFHRLRNRAVLREAGPDRFYLDEESWTALRAVRRQMALAMLVLVLGIALVFYLKRGG
jgi:hypothetical protein